MSEWSFGDDASTGDLPVRTPGRSFGDLDPSPTVGVGTSSIKSSLVDYERGRQAAAAKRSPVIRMSDAATNLNWLLERLCETVPAIRQAVVVSSDGLALAKSEDMDRDTADRLWRRSRRGWSVSPTALRGVSA